MNKNYTSILRGNYKALGYYADELIGARSDHDFFSIIALNVVPLVRKTKAFEPFYYRCLKEKDAYLKEKDALEIKVPNEVEEAFRSLQLALENKDLLCPVEVKQELEIIHGVFSQKHAYGIPSYVQVAYDKICYLLKLILSIGGADLVREYAKIKCQTVYEYNRNQPSEKVQNQAQVPEKVQRWYVNEFTFAPSLLRLNELQNAFKWSKVNNAWIAWEYFVLVEWCWNTPFSFFDDKSLCYNDYKANSASLGLLVLHDYWIELNNIKNDCSDTQGLFFDRARFIEFLKTILHEIILQQEISDNHGSSDIAAEEEVVIPYSLSIKLHRTQLLLEVDWFDDQVTHTYILHSFQSDSGGPYDFMNALLFTEEKVDTNKVCIASGSSVAKYLKYMHLDNIVGRLFIQKPKYNKTHMAEMKSKIIFCKDRAKAEQLELVEFIKSLREYIPVVAS